MYLVPDLPLIQTRNEGQGVGVHSYEKWEKEGCKEPGRIPWAARTVELASLWTWISKIQDLIAEMDIKEREI